MVDTKRRKILEYNTVFQVEKDGGYSVWVPGLPGCTSQGETFDQAMANIREAIGLYLEDGWAHFAMGSSKPSICLSTNSTGC